MTYIVSLLSSFLETANASIHLFRGILSKYILQYTHNQCWGHPEQASGHARMYKTDKKRSWSCLGSIYITGYNRDNLQKHVISKLQVSASDISEKTCSCLKSCLCGRRMFMQLVLVYFLQIIWDILWDRALAVYFYMRLPHVILKLENFYIPMEAHFTDIVYLFYERCILFQECAFICCIWSWRNRIKVQWYLCKKYQRMKEFGDICTHDHHLLFSLHSSSNFKSLSQISHSLSPARLQLTIVILI